MCYNIFNRDNYDIYRVVLVHRNSLNLKEKIAYECYCKRYEFTEFLR